MTRKSFTVLVAGEIESSEFHAVAKWLDALPDDIRVVRSDQPLVASSALSPLPDLLVILQRHPDEIVEEDVANLIDAFPLARIVCCTGAWCASDGRRRSAWPLAVQVPAYRAVKRLNIELQIILGNRAPLPATASRNEIFAFDADSMPASANSRSLIQIQSGDPAYRKWLEELCRHWGYHAVNHAENGRPSIALFDADPWDQANLRKLNTLSRSQSSCPVIVVAGMAHPSDIDEMTASGATFVVDKLAPPVELAAKIAAAVKMAKTNAA